MTHNSSQQSPKFLNSTRRLKLTHRQHTGKLIPHHFTSYPILMMLLLCVGVFLLSWSTFSSADYPGPQSGSYQVNVTVTGPVPKVPATITSPGDNAIFQNQPVTVSGTCEVGTYEELFKNGIFSGSSICSHSATYFIQTGLVTGGNNLVVQDFNFAGEGGPLSNPVNVIYSPVISPLPNQGTGLPTTLKITKVDGNTANNLSGAILVTSPDPTLTGYAPPYSSVTVVAHSITVICYTTANSSGLWACKLPSSLPDGIHEISVSAVDPSGAQLSAPTFQILVESSSSSAANAINNPVPPTLKTNYIYQGYYVGQTTNWTLDIEGGSAPYAISVSWGDGSKSLISRAASGNFDLSHIYTKAGGYKGSYVIQISASDANGVQSYLQLVTIVNNPPNGAGSSPSSNSNTLISGGINTPSTPVSIKNYVWTIYGVLVLMLVSFWLGEKQRNRSTTIHKNKLHKHHS